MSCLYYDICEISDDCDFFLSAGLFDDEFSDTFLDTYIENQKREYREEWFKYMSQNEND